MVRSSLLVLLCAAALASGCSKNGGGGSSSGSSTSGSTGTTRGSSGSSGSGGSSGSTGDAGPTPCSTDTACSGGLVCNAPAGGTGFCAPPCKYDDQCPGSQRCDDSSGHCIDAAPCDDSVVSSPVDACLGAANADYCGTRCRCETDGGGRGAGVCRRVRAYCDPCSTDIQCDPCPAGISDCNLDKFVFPAKCAPIGDAGTFCAQVVSNRGCPFGFLPNSATGACEPQTHTCGGPAACATDQDCVRAIGPGHYCEVSTGICREECQFDYNSGTSRNCSPGQVCNVSPQFVFPDAGLSRYGHGTCGKPCDALGGPDCAALGATGGLSFACVRERSGEHRCRPVSEPDAGGCMDTVECAHPSDGGIYAGYCGIYQFTCRYDCREGIDPVLAIPYADNDCQPPPGSDTSYKCVGSSCVEKNCVDKGGAQFGHNNELCCGEDRDHTGVLDSGFANLADPVNACVPGVDAGQFYPAPAPPWCNVPCDPDPTHVTDDGGLAVFATCDSAAGVPSFDSRGAPNFCLAYAQGKASCLIAANYFSECPRGWGFSGLQVGCQSDADCGSSLPDGGTSTLGHCNVYPDGGGPKTCACTQDEAIDGGGYLYGGQCPDLTRCGHPGAAKRTCIITQGCTPNSAVCP